MTDTKGDRQLPEHVAENRRYWDGMADQWVASGERGWKTDAPEHRKNKLGFQKRR
jgi:hypothetical protein